MARFQGVLVLCVVFLILISGASAATFVINDGGASLSFAATSDNEVAFSIVIAENPDSYSATMSADDSSGASASQESSIGGADSVFSASVAISPDGDSAYTATNAYCGSVNTTQEVHASQSNSATATQNTTSVAAAGASVSNATDSSGNTASECIAFLFGINKVNLTAAATNSAYATQSGTFAGLYAYTIGLAKSMEGDTSNTTSHLVVGGMTYDDHATAHDTTTTAWQDVLIAGALGSAHAGSIDQNGNIATQDALFGAGVLNTNQTTDTLDSATAVQTGDFAGLGALTMGFSLSQDGDVSHTTAGVVIGEMTFDDTATAWNTTTDAIQNVSSAGLFGWTEAGSDDGVNVTHEGSGYVIGDLDVSQQAATGGSAGSRQIGTLNALYGNTWGEATYNNEKSWSKGDVVIGTMAFNSNSIADANTLSEQTINISGIGGIPVAVAGSASAGSDDGTGNITQEGSGILAGTLDVTQQVNTTGSAFAVQNGAMSALLGTTWGEATYTNLENEKSWTKADLFIGTMNFDNNATANASTEAGQHVQVPFAVAANASAGSNDGMGNITQKNAGILIGTFNDSQLADTSGSSYTVQSGTMSALYGSTSGEAVSGDKNSWTKAGVVLGTMTFEDDWALANGATVSNQVVQIGGIDDIPIAGAGCIEAGSTDGTLSSAHVGSEFILGILDQTSQYSDSSSFATQNGSMSAALGRTSGEATYGTNMSWTEAHVVIGNMTFENSNMAFEGFNTVADQTVEMSGIAGLPIAGAGSIEAGSTDGTNTARLGTEFILGALENAAQQTNTGLQPYAHQSGTIPIALYGRTWGEAVDGGGATSWTNGTVVVGTMDFDTSAEAGSSTSAAQTLTMLGLAGNASSGSMDGENSTEVGMAFVLGYLDDLTQQADTSSSAHANQSGILIAGLGNTWGNAMSGNENSWTDVNVTTGFIIVDSNNAAAGPGTSADQDVLVFGAYGNATAGSHDGITSAVVGSEVSGGALDLSAIGNLIEDPSGIIDFIGDILSSGQFGSGIIDMQQQADTSASVHASQTGTVTAFADGRIWGEAASGNNWSRSSADVTSGGILNIPIIGSVPIPGIISVTSNEVNADEAHTNATQNVGISGPVFDLGIFGTYYAPTSRGCASVSSWDGTNNVELGAAFTWSRLSFNQETNTSASAHATQAGNIYGTALSTADTATTWGRAEAGDGDISFTNATVFNGDLTINSNSVYAGSNHTAAAQSVNLSGRGRGSAFTGSVNSVDGNYAFVSAGYLDSGRDSTLDVMQNTETDPTGYVGCATAYQPYVKLRSYNPTMGGVWMLTEAGNTSGRMLSIDTKANSSATNRYVNIIGNSNSSSVGGLPEYSVHEFIAISGTGTPRSNTTVYSISFPTVIFPTSGPATLEIFATI